MSIYYGNASVVLSGIEKLSTSTVVTHFCESFHSDSDALAHTLVRVTIYLRCVLYVASHLREGL